MHIPIRDQCNWLRERIETSEPARPCGSGCSVWRDRLLQTICHAFLCHSAHTRFVTAGYLPVCAQLSSNWCPLKWPACWAQIPYPPERKLHMLDRLAWSEMFESFLASKYTAAKRFGLEARTRASPEQDGMVHVFLALHANAVHSINSLPWHLWLSNVV